MKTFIHADCGAKHKDRNTVPNRQNDANDSPDIVSTLLNISAVANILPSITYFSVTIPNTFIP